MSAKILVTAGYDVTAASDGYMGLEQIKNNPDTAMVITDILMLEKDGIETIREIKQAWANSNHSNVRRRDYSP